jgi:hypothetical protein
MGWFSRKPAPMPVDPAVGAEVSTYIAEATVFIKQNIGRNVDLYRAIDFNDADNLAALCVAIENISSAAFATIVMLRNPQYTLLQVVEKFIADKNKAA